jgi:cytochrome b
VKDGEWQAKWCTVRGLALLSLVSVGLVVGSLGMVTLQWGVLWPSWAGAAASAWALYLLVLTRQLGTEPPGAVVLLRLWLIALMVPALFTFLYGTLAGLCC